MIVPGLAARLKEFREKAGLTQAEAAERAGMYQPDIVRYEKEQRVPTLAQLYKLAAAYGVHVCDLLPTAKRRKK